MTAFIKMHGLGNDFIILDARELANHIPDVISKTAATALADRHFGIGCDQILVIRPSQRADIFLQILNSDGSTAAASQRYKMHCGSYYETSWAKSARHRD